MRMRSSAGGAGDGKAEPGEVGCWHLHSRLTAETDSSDVKIRVKGEREKQGQAGEGEPGQVGRGAARYERGGKRAHRIF